MLQEAQRTSAPSSTRVSIRTGGLDRHVQGAGNAGALERLLAAVLLAQCHQTGHLGLGDVEFLAAEISLIDIGDDAINTELELSRGLVGAATMV